MLRLLESADIVFGSCLAVILALAGCNRAVPDQPAKLTAEQEREILQQVERAAAEEQVELP